MRKLLLLVLLAHFSVCHAESQFIFFRHAEKQFNFSGQLSCQGFNRALRLPERLFNRYGKPDALYASAPIEDKTGSSLRAVTTLLPIAIQTSESIGLQFHAKQTHELVNTLLASEDHSVTYIAWEHDHLVDAVKELVTRSGGDASTIPSIGFFDYDSIYVVKLDNDHHFVSFSLEKEGLNTLSSHCIQPADD